jgi:hypothetical protein
VRRGISILIVSSILAVIPNNISSLTFELSEFLFGLQLLSDPSSMSTFNEIAQFLSRSFWSIMILPSIAFWIWQIRDLIGINQGRRPSILTVKKKITVTIGSIILGVGVAGTVSIVLVTLPFTQAGNTEEFSDIEANFNSTSAFQSQLNQTLRSTAYFLIYVNYAVYLEILFIAIGTFGFIVLVYGMLKRR